MDEDQESGSAATATEPPLDPPLISELNLSPEASDDTDNNMVFSVKSESPVEIIFIDDDDDDEPEKPTIPTADDICLGMFGASEPGTQQYEKVVQNVVEEGLDWNKSYKKIRDALHHHRFLVKIDCRWYRASDTEIIQEISNTYLKYSRQVKDDRVLSSSRPIVIVDTQTKKDNGKACMQKDSSEKPVELGMKEAGNTGTEQMEKSESSDKPHDNGGNLPAGGIQLKDSDVCFAGGLNRPGWDNEGSQMLRAEVQKLCASPRSTHLSKAGYEAIVESLKDRRFLIPVRRNWREATPKEMRKKIGRTFEYYKTKNVRTKAPRSPARSSEKKREENNARTRSSKTAIVKHPKPSDVCFAKGSNHPGWSNKGTQEYRKVLAQIIKETNGAGLPEKDYKKLLGRLGKRRFLAPARHGWRPAEPEEMRMTITRSYKYQIAKGSGQKNGKKTTAKHVPEFSGIDTEDSRQKESARSPKRIMEQSAAQGPRKRQNRGLTAQKAIKEAIAACEAQAKEARDSQQFHRLPDAMIAEEKRRHLSELQTALIAQEERSKQAHKSLSTADQLLQAEVAEEIMNRAADANAHLVHYVHCFMWSST